jgi:hypothetical protein
MLFDPDGSRRPRTLRDALSSKTYLAGRLAIGVLLWLVFTVALTGAIVTAIVLPRLEIRLNEPDPPTTRYEEY